VDTQLDTRFVALATVPLMPYPVRSTGSRSKPPETPVGVPSAAARKPNPTAAASLTTSSPP
jgi:hypothetical protein